MTKKEFSTRESYILAKSLIWALKYAKTLLDHERDWSDEEQMRAILEDHFEIFKITIEDEYMARNQLMKSNS